jgi:hypothetical protein
MKYSSEIHFDDKIKAFTANSKALYHFFYLSDEPNKVKHTILRIFLIDEKLQRLMN